VFEIGHSVSAAEEDLPVLGEQDSAIEVASLDSCGHVLIDSGSKFRGRRPIGQRDLRDREDERGAQG
jgi:hypothetical protein